MKKNTSLGEMIIGFLIVGFNLAIGLTFTIIPLVRMNNKSLGDIIVFLIFYPLTAYTLLFLILFIYMIINLFKKIFNKSKEVIMIVKKVHGKHYVLVDEKGNRYEYYTKNTLNINKCYRVIKNNFFIEKVLEETYEPFSFNGIKYNYFEKFYTPFGDYQGFTLVIVIVIFFMTLVEIITSIILLAIIIYDASVKYRIYIKMKQLYIENPEYTIEDIKNIEKSIEGNDAPITSKIVNFFVNFRKYIILLLIIITIIYVMFIVKK